MFPDYEKLLFQGANDFSMFIEEIATTKKSSCIDTILLYCKENFVDIQDLKPLISQSLKDKLEVEFQELRMLPKGATLFGV